MITATNSVSHWRSSSGRSLMRADSLGGFFAAAGFGVGWLAAGPTRHKERRAWRKHAERNRDFMLGDRNLMPWHLALCPKLPRQRGSFEDIFGVRNETARAFFSGGLAGGADRAVR